MEIFQPFGTPGIDLIRSLQTLPSLFWPMRIVSWLGEESFFILLIAFLFAAVRPSLAVRLLVLLLISNYINCIGKWVFHGPRPFWLDGGLEAIVIEKTYGVPSGHAQNAMAMWGFLAIETARRYGKLTYLAAGMTILLICVSRLALAMHFPHDILVGLVLGAAILFAFIRFEKSFSGWAQAAKPPVRSALPVVVSFFMIAGAVAVIRFLSGIEDPQSWTLTAAARGTAFAPAPREFDTVAITAGIMAVLGLVDSTRYEPAAGWKKFAAFAVVVGGILIVRGGLGLLRPENEVILQIVRFVRYGLVAVWGFWAAPALLARFGLMRSVSRGAD